MPLMMKIFIYLQKSLQNAYNNQSFIMSDFKTFETNKKAKFLNKAKEVKAKREQDIKKIQSIIVIQKNIRSYMTYRRYGSPLYPLLINQLDEIRNKDYIQLFWKSPQFQSKMLKLRFIILGIRSLRNHEQSQLNTNLVHAIISYSKNKQLKWIEYYSILKHYWQLLDCVYFKQCLKYTSFSQALKCFMNMNIHQITDIIVKFEDIDVINNLINSYLSAQQGAMQIQEQQNEERLLKSYYNAVALLNQIINDKKDNNAIMQLVSILVIKLKTYFTNMIFRKYKIDKSLSESATLKEEVEQFLKQKKQWEQYEGHLYHLCKLIPNILQNYVSIQSKSLSYALDILIEVTKLNESVVSVGISANQFFILIQRLNLNTFMNRQQQMNRYYEFLMIIIMLEKYLQGINDLKFIQLFKFQVDRLKDTIRTYVIKFMKNLITFNSTFSIVGQIIKHSIAFLNNLYNKIFRTNIVKTAIFQDSSINIFQGNYKYSNYGNAAYMKELIKIVERCPYILPIEARFLIFRKMIQEDHFHDNYHGNKSLIIHRGRQFQDAFDQLYNRNIKSSFHVKFVNQLGKQEQGMDAGGLTKELLTRIFKIAFNPSFGRFIENDKKELLPNPEYQNIEDGKMARQYEFIGRLLGKSLYKNIMLGIKFAGPFLNLLINNKNTFDDLLQIDSSLYKSLIYIVQMKEGVQQLELTFQYHDNLTKKIINLKPNGDKIKVNSSNKDQYVNLLINYKVNRSIKKQTRYIRKGLKAVINQNWIKMFNYAQFNYLLSGTGKIDVADWMKHTRVHGTEDCEKLINDFWSIVSQFDEQQKSLLLKFVTSCQRPSFLGFKDLQPPFSIRVLKKDDNLLPVSHTCSNFLDLPQYSSRKVMKQKLLYAIKSGAGFQMG